MKIYTVSNFSRPPCLLSNSLWSQVTSAPLSLTHLARAKAA